MTTYYTLTKDTVVKLELKGNVTFECAKETDNYLKLKIFSKSEEIEGLLVIKENNKTRIITDKDKFRFPDDAKMIFYYCKATSLDLRNFETDNVTSMNGMFMCCRAKHINLSSFNTENVEDFNRMFYASEVESLDLSNFKTAKAKDMGGMFGRLKLDTLDLSSFNTSKVLSMSCMFQEAKIGSLNLSSFDTSNVENMRGMFKCFKIPSLNVNNFKTSKVTDMGHMFLGVEVDALDLGTFDTSNVEKMYKSEAYINIMSNAESSFLVGRKGSGKTTFFEVLEKYDPQEFDSHFKVLRPISVEDIREEHLYCSINKMSMDYKIFGLGRVLELFWEIYFHLCAIFIVCVEEENHRIRDDRRSIFRMIGNKLKKVLNVSALDSGDVKKSIFTQSTVLWEEFLSTEILNYATEEAFLASMDANFNVDNVMRNFFGKVEYRKLVKAIERCDKKILVALDKFDAISDDFRREAKRERQSNDEKIRCRGEKKGEFDRLFYRSLILAVERLRMIDTGIMGQATFCIIIPQDRIDQIKMVDRDFSKRNFISLTWDAIELLRVVLLRLKVLYKFEYDIKEDDVKKFKEVMAKYMPTIPLEVIIEIDEKEKKIDLFQYILRISFWRPRDVIKYFSVLYDANEKNINKHDAIDMETLKNLLNNVTEDIIENEFYNEYDKVFFNIDELMSEFEDGNIICESSEIIDTIRAFKFEGVMFDEENEIIGKLRLLYELGVIGLQFNSKDVKKRNIGYNLCFVFNEGLYPFNRVKDELIKGKSNVKVVLNPIFAKKLSLKYNTLDIIGAYSWEYLQDNHIRKKGINRL